VAWFRIVYARNAFLRSLESPLDTLTPAGGIAAMQRFMRDFRPQHAELDVFECSWRPDEGGFAFTLTRRMRRHGHPEATLNLVFEYAASPTRTSLRGSAPGSVAKGTEGYRAISRATVRARRLV
jgi:hypothetical protein